MSCNKPTFATGMELTSSSPVDSRDAIQVLESGPLNYHSNLGTA